MSHAADHKRAYDRAYKKRNAERIARQMREWRERVQKPARKAARERASWYLRLGPDAPPPVKRRWSSNDVEIFHRLKRFGFSSSEIGIVLQRTAEAVKEKAQHQRQFATQWAHAEYLLTLHEERRHAA